MLTHLSIRNIVLIEACDITLADGLCVLTGETGAGKSILLDALGLALGARGDASLVRHGESAGSVTAEFDIGNNPGAQAVLRELELEPDASLIIRRSVGTDGKARCLANDQPISVTALKRLGETLVEVHGQHDQRGLMDASTHRALLDEYGRHAALLKDTQQSYALWRQAEAALAQVRADIEHSKREEEFLRHMTRELQKLSPQAGEEEAMAAQRTEMMQSEKLFSTINEALGELSGKGHGASMSLRSVQRTLLRSALNANNRFSTIIDALDRAANEADEAEQALERLAKEATYNPARLEEIEERLFALKAAARKYHVSAQELVGLKEQSEAKLALIDSREGALARCVQAEQAARHTFLEHAGKLTKKREAAGARLCKAVEAELEPLKMGSSRFRVSIQPHAEANWSGAGVDAVMFEAATNVSKKADIPFAPITKIASGGELSRFMLAVKVALAEVRSTPTLVFDEIDTGTGGAVADAIGARLAQLGKAAQVLVVTHLPQVAARGAQHLQVAKEETKGRVSTTVRTLDASARREELARMLAGSTITPEARKAAQKLLEHAA